MHARFFPCIDAPYVGPRPGHMHAPSVPVQAAPSTSLHYSSSRAAGEHREAEEEILLPQ